MSNIVEGVVFRVYDKNFNNKTLYSVKLDGDDTYYRLGTNRREGVIEPGYRVKLEVEEKGSQTHVIRVKVLEKGKPLEPGQSADSRDGRESGSGVGQRVVLSGAGAYNDRQADITYQSARNAAIDVVTLLITSGAIALPAAKGKTDDRRTVIEGYIDAYTAQYYEDVATKGAVARHQEEVGVDTVDEDDDAPFDDDDAAGDAGGDDEPGWDD